MNTVYLIGGRPRTGKSTVMQAFIKQRPMPAYSFDAVRNGLRNALFEEVHVDVKKLDFSGDVVFKVPGKAGDKHKHFEHKLKKEEELTWDALLGIIEHYSRHFDRSDLVIEGSGITPERVHNLSFDSLAIRAVFTGFLDSNHADTIIEHARTNKDWVHTWLQETGNNEDDVRQWLHGEHKASQEDKKMAAKFGYGYFDVSTGPFEQHVQAVTQYLLQKA